MSELITALQTKFGTNKVRVISFKNTSDEQLLNYQFILIEIQKRSKINVLMTNGLSNFEMNVPEKHQNSKNIELYFCLPSYWDFENQEDENLNWVFPTLFRYHQHILSKNTWFGVGHTIPFSNPLKAISTSMKQSYFFVNEPIFLKDEMTALTIGEKNVHFLALIPIFEDELDYKMGKGTYKFQKKLHAQNVSELLDDYRATVLKSKWRFFGKSNG
jgi:hypothetical protein